MSRALPAHANLEHLKKQAKDLLRELQQQDPGSKLADAQHAIAREYGCASWPKLKALVESHALQADTPEPLAAAEPSDGRSGGRRGGVAVNVIAGPPPNYDFGRYTLKARQAMFFSRDEASQIGSATIEPEHLLLGLIRAGQGLTSRIFERAHLSLEHARAEVAAATVVRETLPTSVEIPFGAETRRLFQYTVEEANDLQHQNIGIAHLLLGILRDEQSVATSILRDNGMRLHAVRDDIVQLLNEEPL